MGTSDDLGWCSRSDFVRRFDLMKTAAANRGGFMLYYHCSFGCPPSDGELPQGSGCGGAEEANPDRQDKTLQSNRRWEHVVAMSNEKKKSRMAYFIACVSEFAKAHGLAQHESFDYLDRYKGMDFLIKCYEAEHTLSFADAVNDLNVVCRRHGGRI